MYLPYVGGGVPTLVGGVLTLAEGRRGGGGGDAYLGQVMPRAVCFLRLPAGRLTCL